MNSHVLSCAAFVLTALSALSGTIPAWASCEAEAGALEAAQKRMTAAVWELNVHRSRAQARFEDSGLRWREGDEHWIQRSSLEDDPDYFIAQQERRSAWKAWRKAKLGLDACQKASDEENGHQTA